MHNESISLIEKVPLNWSIYVVLILIFKEAGDRVHATAFNTSHEQFVAFFAHVQEPLLSTVRSLCIAHCPIDTFFSKAAKGFIVDMTPRSKVGAFFFFFLSIILRPARTEEDMSEVAELVRGYICL